jgi:hypothetical protein
LGRGIACGEGRYFSDSKTGIDGRDDFQSIAVSMAGGLDDAEDPSNFRVRKD